MKKLKILSLSVILFVCLPLILSSKDYKTHEVQKGETAWRISKIYHISVKDLCELNGIDDITKIKTGMKLKIPDGTKQEASTVKSINEIQIHVLQKGETIWQLSKKYHVQADEICKLNKIENLSLVKIGTEIKIPGSKNTSVVYSKNNSSASLASSNEDLFTYTLKKGDTLYSVGRKYKVDVKELCRLNNIDDLTKIKIGMEIKLPQKVEYLDYKIPLCGEINLFKNSHFRGIHIFADEDVSKRNVLAIEKGEVTYIDIIPGYGLSVFIKHENGLLSTYSGMESTSIKIGDKVEENMVIGIAGKLSRYNKYGILFSIQDKGYGLAFDMKKQKFFKG